jgi:superfamily I DNA/RNA helicase/Zn-dependent peptidase ImmA (M78 family)
MNSFDAARQAARALRNRVLDSGAPAAEPLAVALAAAAELDYEVSWLAPGDERLHGAEALVDAQAGVIRCNGSGPDGDRALRLAHEVGHEAVHRLSSAPPGGGGGATFPLGRERVVDYGPRERRELEAEVFAREFLFPAEDARDMHLARGLTSTDIARDLGLPRGVVERQLLDSLLLPVVAPLPSDAVAPQQLLDPSQEVAVSHGEGPFLLEAGPGTGKTRTLVARVRALVDRGVDASSILVLTFSNRAAGEASERISAQLPEDGHRVWTGTFHQFGMDLIHRHHDLLELPARPTLLDNAAAVEALEELLPTLGLVHHRNLWEPTLLLRDVLRAISRSKDELVGPERYAELGHAMLADAVDDVSRVLAERSLEVAKVYEVYQAKLRQLGAVDFGDQVMLPALLLEANPGVAVELRARHTHVLVDEYQDVNRASVRMLKGLAGPGGNVWAVGDARQAIYRFRGASSSSMTRFGDDFGPFSSARLSVNYRSTGEVVRTFVGFAGTMAAGTDGAPIALAARRGNVGHGPELVLCGDDGAELSAIVAEVQALASRGVSYGDQAVLCRGNAAVDEVSRALETAGIPVLRLGNLLERDEVRDLLSILTLAADATGSGFPRVGSMPRYRMTLADVQLLAGALADRAPRTVLEALHALSAEVGLSESGREGLRVLSRDLTGLGSGTAPWTFLITYMLDRTRWLADLAMTGAGVEGEMRRLAVWTLMEAVRLQPPGGAAPPIHRLLTRLRRVTMLGEARSLGEVPHQARALDAVHVMTVHASKGLEFEAVHLPGLCERRFPLSYKVSACPPPRGLIDADRGAAPSPQDEALAEEECLFFVALSRAKTHLRLYVSAATTGARRQALRPSRFLDHVAPFVTRRTSASTAPSSVGADLPVTVEWSECTPVVEAHHLDLYGRCPRRFLLTAVIGIRAARRTGPFERTHDAAARLLRLLGSGDGPGSAPDVARLLTVFDAIWLEHGPHDHAYAADYRAMADAIVRELHGHLRGRRTLAPRFLAVTLEAGRVIVRSEDSFVADDGSTVIRRIRTGTDRGDGAFENDIAYALLHLAAQEIAGMVPRIEAVHLSDGAVRETNLSARQVENRRQKAGELMAALGRGQFPPRPKESDCPRCPHWFGCGRLPHGIVRARDSDTARAA